MPTPSASGCTSIRRKGYTWAIEEFDPGISSVAAPIADASGEVIAAVHVHGPSYRFPPPGRESELGQAVVAGGRADRRGVARGVVSRGFGPGVRGGQAPGRAARV